jgi:hypothetical protein
MKLLLHVMKAPIANPCMTPPICPTCGRQSYRWGSIQVRDWLKVRLPSGTVCYYCPKCKGAALELLEPIRKAMEEEEQV